MPQLLILHHIQMSGENVGLLVQHVESLRDLLHRRDWSVQATDRLDPQLASLALSADVVLVQMLDVPEVEAIVRLRRRLGLPTVFEITDNFLGITDWAAPAHLLRSPLVRQNILNHAAMSDAIQVYAPGLAELFARVNDRVIAFDPYVPIPDEVSPKPEGFVLGWGGTSTHEPDLTPIAPVLEAFCARHPDARFHYMGNQAVFARLFGGIDPRQTAVRPFGDHDAYLDFVAGLHVGLGPLRPSAFNAARTDTRFAAFAAHGVAGVLEDGLVYRPHADRARLFRSPQELEKVLEELYASPASVADLAERGRAWVVELRNAEVLAYQRDAAYRALHSSERVSDSSLLLDGAAVTGDRAALESARGLDPAEALETAEQIVSAHPRYEQAHLLLAQSLERLGRHAEALAHAERLKPSPVYADLFAELQVRCARKVAPDQVARYVERILSPARAARFRAGGSVLERSRRILEHQPYDYFALAATIRLLAAQNPDAEELDSLYQRACLVSPDDVPPDRRPPELAAFLRA